MRNVNIIALLLCLTAGMATSVFAEMLEVKSIPEKAEVFVRSPATNRLSRVGVTPLKLDFDNISRNYTQSKNFMLILKKSDHEDYRVLLTKPKSSDVTLLANLNLINRSENIKKYDELINKLFDAQRLIRAKNYDDAITKLGVLEETHSEISSIYEMKAMAYYMKGNVNESLSYYRKSFSVNPTNKDAYTMKVYLEKELGLTRTPASK